MAWHAELKSLAEALRLRSLMGMKMQRCVPEPQRSLTNADVAVRLQRGRYSIHIMFQVLDQQI